MMTTFDTTDGREVMSPARDIVVFRRRRDTGSIVALFPETPADCFGWFCYSYEHTGQGGAAEYGLVIGQTVPASPDAYAELASELTDRGFNLKPVRRATAAHHARRASQIRQWKGRENQ